MTDAYILEAIRTPRGRGSDKGALHGVRPIELVGQLLQALETRTSLSPRDVDDVVLGCVTQVGDQGTNIAKLAALWAGWDDAVPGMTVTRFCTSGLDAIGTAAARVMAGMDDLIVAGGVESMSRVPMLADEGAWFKDREVAKRTGFIHMGLSADLVATRDGISREDADAYAARSHRRAAEAWERGAFQKSVVAVKGEGGEVLLEKDERIRPGLQPADIQGKPPAFAEMGAHGGDALAMSKYPELDHIEHVHSTATAPGIVDGAGLVLIGTLEKAQALGLTPRAKIRGYSAASVEPVLMLTAPKPASERALSRAGLSVSDVDLFEVNESFSAPVLSYVRALGLDEDQVNVNGGAIAMGHPLGASGAILVGTVLDELEARGQTIGLATLCAGAGLGAACVVERV